MKKKWGVTRTPLESFRAQTLQRVESKELFLQDAAQILQLSYSQVKRLFNRFKTEGAAGLAHRSRGKASNRACCGRPERGYPPALPRT
jgi:transposase